MTIAAPKRTLLAMSPWWRMPPSAMIGLVATRAHHFSAESCQPPVPKPVFSLVMQTLPGPTPTLVASAPQFSRSITPSGVADVAGDHERLGSGLDVLDHAAHAVGVAVRDVDRDVVGAHAFGGQPVDVAWRAVLTPELIDTNRFSLAHARANARLSRSKRCIT